VQSESEIISNPSIPENPLSQEQPQDRRHSETVDWSQRRKLSISTDEGDALHHFEPGPPSKESTVVFTIKKPQRPTTYRSLSSNVLFGSKGSSKNPSMTAEAKSGSTGPVPTPVAVHAPIITPPHSEPLAKDTHKKRKRSFIFWRSSSGDGKLEANEKHKALPPVHGVPAGLVSLPTTPAAIPTSLLHHAQPSSFAAEARKVTQSPSAKAVGKHPMIEEYFSDVRGPRSKHHRGASSAIDDDIMEAPTSDLLKPAIGPMSAPVASSEKEWFRVKVDDIPRGAESSDSEDNVQDKDRFHWDVPEHLPGSPLCPLSPKHKAGGKGICVYHGRQKSKAGGGSLKEMLMDKPQKKDKLESWLGGGFSV